MYRQAFRYAADNYDKFRNADLHDGYINYSRLGGDDNADSLTGRDANAVQEQFHDYLHIPQKQQALDTLIQHFDEIDTDRLGYITARTTERCIDSEHLTLADFQRRKTELLAHSKELRESWNLPEIHQ